MTRRLASFPALLAILSTGCSASAGNDAADARAQIARQVDGARACATLVATGGTLEFSADLMSAASIEALAAAGLIGREPVTTGADERPRVRIVAGPAGKSDVRMVTAADGAVSPELCFGTRQLTAVRSESDGAGGQRMRYSYRIVDAPAWTRDPQIRRAFPFMVRLLDGQHEADAAAFEQDGAWRIPGDPKTSMIAEIGNKGFFPCPVPDPDRASPCT